MKRAFTLIELLVVVAIIALMAALLATGSKSARDAEKRVRCLTHLREWASAMSYYAHDNDGYLPRRGQGVNATVQISRPEDWFNALPPYLKLDRFSQMVQSDHKPKPGDNTLWVCPVAQEAGYPYFFAYAMNMMLSTWVEPKPERIDSVGGTNTMVFLADGPGGHCSTVPTYERYSPLARHRGMVNLAFLDGHVESFSGTYIGCGVGDPKRSDVRWVVPGRNWSEPGQPTHHGSQGNP